MLKRYVIDRRWIGFFVEVPYFRRKNQSHYVLKYKRHKMGRFGVRYILIEKRKLCNIW